MRKAVLTLVMMLALAFLLGGGRSPNAAATEGSDKGRRKLFLANYTQSTLTVTAACGAAATISAAPGEVAFVDCPDPTAVAVGVAGEGVAALDAAVEQNFALAPTCSDGTRPLQGAVEIVEGLRPQRRDHFVYVWTIGECAR